MLVLCGPPSAWHGQRTLHQVDQAGAHRVAGFGHEHRGFRLVGLRGGAHRASGRESHGPVGHPRHRGRASRGRRDLPDVPGIQLGQTLVLAAPRGGQDQLHRGPVLPGLLGDLGQVADRQLLAVQRQVVERPPGSAGYVVRKVHLSLGPLGLGARLEDRGHVGVGRGLAGPLLRLVQAPFGGLELPARGAAPCGDVAAPAECVAGVGGQVTRHLGQVVVAGPAEAHRPGQRRGGRPGQVTQEVEPRLHGGVLVVEGADGVAAPFGFGAQPRGLVPERVGAVAVVNLDGQQGQAGPACRHPDRRRIHAGRRPPITTACVPCVMLTVPPRCTRAPSLKTVYRRDRRVKYPRVRHRSGSPSLPWPGAEPG